MMDPVQFERLKWIARRWGIGVRPPQDLFGRTTWPQEVSGAAKAALDEIERLIEIIETSATTQS